ncbi:MAG: hypothetical protein JSV99_01685 [Planctomycetota bacterium]|nr:MAG: hypothetical protein JSV99_01685 [Planctomycetota bacterium]
MKFKRPFFAVLMVFLVLLTSSGSKAVDTADIDAVRSKGVLDAKDLRVIDRFVGDAVAELIQTRDFTSIAKVRTVILSRNSSGTDSAEAQYAAQFSESAHKYISEALERASVLRGEDHRFKAILNLLILVDGLEDLGLADLAMRWLNDESPVIRYWAVHCITSSGFVEKLNASTGGNPGLASEIAGQLKGLVDSSSPEILVLMTEFSGGVEIPEAEELLLQIADVRIGRYADWTVEYELLDGAVLKVLDAKIGPSGEGKAAMGRRFGQLYSYVAQRYVRGQDFLSAEKKHQLGSVLVETEILCISKRTRIAQSVIKTAVEQEDYAALMEEHNRLLGDETRAGQLASMLKFDYGKNPDGSSRIAPLALSEPPKEQVSQ